MKRSRERDQAVERLLRRSFAAREADASAGCLDVETMSAYVDGNLVGAQFESAQAHLADCAHCQTILGAMARTMTITAPTPAVAQFAWRAWLVPVTAAAAAVALWVAIPRDERMPMTLPPAAQQEAVADARARAVAPLEKEGAAPQVLAKPDQAADALKDSAVEERMQAAAGRRDAAPAREADRLEAQANAEPRTFAAAAPSGGQGAASLMRSAPIRWRISGGRVERLTDNATWERVAIADAGELIAGSSPSSNVFWAVGRAGAVLLTVDGTMFARVAFPEATDLASVGAVDARTATVTTADGRTFTTTDGGTTWRGEP